MISKYIFIHVIKINFYSIKYVYMIPKYIFIQPKKNYIQKQKIYYKTFFHPIKTFFYLNVSFDTFLVTISGLSFLFAKVEILLSVCKLKSSAML